VARIGSDMANYKSAASWKLALTFRSKHTENNHRALVGNKIYKGASKMNKIVASMLISSSLVFGSGIPVVDGLANSQMATQNIKQIAEWVETAQRWSNTATHFQSQLTAYQDQLMSATQIRNSVQFVKDITEFYNFAKNYKDDYLKLGTDILNSNTILGIRANDLFDKYNVFDECNTNYFTTQEKNICKNKMVRRVHEVAVYQEYSNSLGVMTDNLTDLSNKLANSQDIKESQDIGNAIQLQVAQIDLTRTQVELMNAQNARLDKIEEKQKEQLFLQSIRANDTRNHNW
jgi:type IV secretion system protein VirB5